MWIPVFKTGKHTDSSGNEREWTDADVQQIAASYNPANHEAPVVLGHPKDNAPAYGWVEALKVEGDTLLAKLKDLAPAFVDAVRQGQYKKRSISLYGDNTLRHVGFLGAMPPAIKGLADVAFNDDARTQHIDSDFSDKSKQEDNMNFMQKIKDLLKAEGVDVSDVTEPKTYSEAETAQIVAAATAKTAAEFTEQERTRQAEHATRLQEIDAREKALKEKEAADKKAGIAAFCEGLAKEGKIVPAMTKLGMGLQAFMEQISEITAPVEFGEGDSAGKQTPLEFIQAFMAALPKVVEFGEVAADKGSTAAGDSGQKIAALVTAKMQANATLTYGQAFAEVQKENVELATAYASEMKG